MSNEQLQYKVESRNEISNDPKEVVEDATNSINNINLKLIPRDITENKTINIKNSMNLKLITKEITENTINSKLISN